VGGLMSGAKGAIAGHLVGQGAGMAAGALGRAGEGFAHMLMRGSGTNLAAVARTAPPEIQRLIAAVLQRASQGGPAALRAGVYLLLQNPQFRAWSQPAA